MNLKLKIWRQKNAHSQGKFVDYTVENISPDTSFLEMLDILNNDLIHKGEEPVVFDHDCREGICGMCSLHINGHAHGPDEDITTCPLHMRKFHDGETITIEPWRSRAFPVIKDLAVDRSAFDKILQAGGFVSVGTGGVPDANTIPIPKPDADESMDAAACIGCGACVATCKNGSAMLFACRRSLSCRRAVSRARVVRRRWWPRWTSWASAPARTPAPARPSARKASRSPTSPGSTVSSCRPS